ncbi:hypothetical protein JRQ81_012348 [Phrynocephalus forsythii]|uniref:Serpin domain-containing protein n=1 Tax=Phrynocephalus forsythii TaxID=171643 RepID=A0A9Q0Y107_9SAUR|nr:hypothetical protein JRQ81_012348 [Phrynocephalus forsythii]
MTSLPDANAKFAVDLYHQLKEEHPCENILFSPVNATSALSVLAMASGGKQAVKIKKVLHWDELEECHVSSNRSYFEAVTTFGQSLTGAPKCDCETPKGDHTAFRKILASLNEPSSNYTLSFANKIYGDHAIAFLQKFIYCALTMNWTDVESIDLQNAPEEVRRIINLWVDFQTHGKIKALLPKDALDSLAQLLQVNSLYFKGQWQVRFDEQLTTEAPFYSHDASQRAHRTVSLMNRKGVYNIAVFQIGETEVQVLEIPYKDNALSLFVLLPTDCSHGALQELEDSLTHEHLLDWSGQLKPEEVEVFIPKFSLEKSLYAIEYVDLPDLQDPEKADFSQATTTEKVALTQLVHDTFIEIDEEGGEEVQPPRRPRDRRPHRKAVEVVADHPFLYYILHKPTQSVIALGKFAKPE